MKSGFRRVEVARVLDLTVPAETVEQVLVLLARELDGVMSAGGPGALFTVSVNWWPNASA
jgi:hypothetical protein